MSSGRILIADDEPSVRDSVGYALAQEGFEVTPAADGDEAAEKLGDGIPFDLLILDIMMPGPSGLDICRDVRSRSAVPIIVLTAKDAEVDKVVGLEVGADDYVTKPFSVRELLGRVRAQLRRRELDRSPLAQAVRIEAGQVAIDLVRHVATVRGEPVNLTRSGVPAPPPHGRPPRRGLPPPPDHGGAVADRVRRRRASLRRPHLQPPPEGRARPPAPRAGPDRARRRLQVQRRPLGGGGGGGVATETTRAEYAAQVEPICKTNTQANERILKGVKTEVKQGKLKPAAKQFSKASAALKKALAQLKAVPKPAADQAKLTKWLGYVKTEAELFQSTSKKLATGNKIGAQAMVIRLTHNANLANDSVPRASNSPTAASTLQVQLS